MDLLVRGQRSPPKPLKFNYKKYFLNILLYDPLKFGIGTAACVLVVDYVHISATKAHNPLIELFFCSYSITIGVGKEICRTS